jgi:hypothetical protein
MPQRAFGGLGVDIPDTVEAPDRVVSDDLGLLRQLNAVKLGKVS